MSNRVKPDGTSQGIWDDFEVWAESLNSDLGESLEDFGPWLKAFEAGWEAGGSDQFDAGYEAGWADGYEEGKGDLT